MRGNKKPTYESVCKRDCMVEWLYVTQQNCTSQTTACSKIVVK